MIEACSISKNFGPLKALQDVSMTISKGSVCGVLGPNGCGKSTLIKTILGLVLPTTGSIRVCDELVTPRGAHREHIGYLPQNPDFPSNLTARELFGLVEDIRGKSGLRKEELIERFELSASLSRPLGTLSGGTKQKIASVLAFMFDAPVLILDEPSVGLDPVSAARFKALVKSEAASGKTIVLVSHLMNEAEQLVDQMIFLLEGKVFCAGTIAQMYARTGTASLEAAMFALLCNAASERESELRENSCHARA